MIKELRVDDRLIHGQIALTWPSQLGINHIVVANDNASTDKTQQATLKMAVQGDVKVLIRSVDDTIKLMQNPKAKSVGMMVLVSCVVDAERLFSALGSDNIERINIANVGRFDGIPKDQKAQLNATIYLTKADKEAADKLLEQNANVVSQIIPSDKVVKFSNIMKEG